MNRSFLLVVLLFLFPSDQFQAQTGTPKVEPAANPEVRSLYEDGIERFEMGQVSEAVERFQKAIKLDPEYVPAYSALGRAYFKLKQWENASEMFRQAIALKQKKRESQDKPQKNQVRNTEPDVAPAIPSTKPKKTSPIKNPARKY